METFMFKGKSCFLYKIFSANDCIKHCTGLSYEVSRHSCKTAPFAQCLSSHELDFRFCEVLQFQVFCFLTCYHRHSSCLHFLSIINDLTTRNRDRSIGRKCDNSSSYWFSVVKLLIQSLNFKDTILSFNNLTAGGDSCFVFYEFLEQTQHKEKQ